MTSLASASSPLLTAKQVSDRLQRPERTLERWRLTGEGPPFVRMGRRVAYRVEDLDRWINGHTYASRAAELAGRPSAA